MCRITRRLAIPMCTSFWRRNPLPCLYIPTLWIYILLNERESEAFRIIDCLVMKRGNFFLVSRLTQSYSHFSTRVAFECHTVISSGKRFCPTVKRLICKAASLSTLTSECPCSRVRFFEWHNSGKHCVYSVRSLCVARITKEGSELLVKAFCSPLLYAYS